MKQGLWMALMLCLSACTNPKIHSDRVFANAQILYQDKKANTDSKRAALEMPSYFIDLDYKPGQTKLSATQVKKVEDMLKKLDYPDEYHIYASLGASGSSDQVANIAGIVKRGEDIRKRYGNRVKDVKVAYLKTQKPDSVYIRLLG